MQQRQYSDRQSVGEPDAGDLDRAGIDRLLSAAKAKGWDGTRWTNLVREILELGAEIAAAARDGSPTRTARAGQLTRDGMLAVMAKDPVALLHAFTNLRTFALERITPAQLDAYGQRALAQIQSVPFGPSLLSGSIAQGQDVLRRLAALLCLDGLLPQQPGKGERDDAVASFLRALFDAGPGGAKLFRDIPVADKKTMASYLGGGNSWNAQKKGLMLTMSKVTGTWDRNFGNDQQAQDYLRRYAGVL